MTSIDTNNDEDVKMLQDGLASIKLLTAKLDDIKASTLTLDLNYQEFANRTAAVRKVLSLGRAMAISSAQIWSDVELAVSVSYFVKIAKNYISNLKFSTSSILNFSIEHIIEISASTGDMGGVPGQIVDPDHVGFRCKARVNFAGQELILAFIFSVYIVCTSGKPVFKVANGIQIYGLPDSFNDKLEEAQQGFTQQLNEALTAAASQMIGPLSDLNTLGLPSVPTFLTAFTTKTSINILGTFQNVVTINPTLSSTDKEVPSYYRKQLQNIHSGSPGAVTSPIPTQPKLPTIPKVPRQADATIKIRSSVVAQAVRNMIYAQVSTQDSFSDISAPRIVGVADPFAMIGGQIDFTVHFSFELLGFFDVYDYYSPVEIYFNPGQQLLCTLQYENYDGYGIYDWGIQIHTHPVTQTNPIQIGSATYVEPALTPDALYLHLYFPSN